MAGGEDAVFRAVEGAEDRADEGAPRRQRAAPGRPADRDLRQLGDAVRARRAGERRARAASRTVLVTCAPRPGLRALADVVIAIATGPEVLTGSTRLKAGSATKAVLNAITTAAMVRLGKAYENLMVDVKPNSAKLRDRCGASWPPPPL